MPLIRHIGAIGLSLIVTVAVLILTSSPPLFIADICCGAFSLIWATVIWWPIAVQAETELIIKRNWKWWAYLPTIIAFCFLISLLIITGFTLLINAGRANLSTLTELAVEMTLWGTIYSVIFVALRRLRLNSRYSSSAPANRTQDQ